MRLAADFPPRQHDGGRLRFGRRRLAALTACAAVSLALAACGGGSGSAGTSPPIVQPISVTLNLIGISTSSVSGTVSASDPQGRTLTYAVAGAPTVGTVTLNASTGVFTYSVAGLVTPTTDSFSVNVSNGGSSASELVTVRLQGDPLVGYQWHLQNAGRSAFSSTLPVAGNDLNVAGAWAAGYSGQGVKVAVVDSGLEAAHEDLAANVDLAHSYNFTTGTSDPTRATSDIGFDHGTAVAGIVAAVAFNGKGGRGIAYNARLRGYNLLADNFTVANYAMAMGGMTASADNAIFNASFDITNAAPVLPPQDSSLTAVQANLQTLRGGLGAVLVNAAGNDYLDWESLPGTGACTLANTYGVSCGDPMYDTRLGGYTPVIVGAINADGVKASYSSAGSALWVSAPGGEYGFDSGFVSSTNPNVFKPAIVTTNRGGCANTNYPQPRNALDNRGLNPLAANCQYTAVMNGTSSAAPSTSGTIALMLEANPNLGWRDVKYILAKTARKVDASRGPVSTGAILPGKTITLDQGWVKNAAGFWFSNWYGFGAVDAAAAVAMAKTYTATLPAIRESSNYYWPSVQGMTVPALSSAGLSMLANVSEPFTTVEHVVLFPNIGQTQAIQCNQIEVVSPSGTRSIVLHAGNGFLQTSAIGFRILSNAFYGEPLNGTWTVTYFNFCSGPTVLSTTQPQVIGFSGR